MDGVVVALLEDAQLPALPRPPSSSGCTVREGSTLIRIPTADDRRLIDPRRLAELQRDVIGLVDDQVLEDLDRHEVPHRGRARVDHLPSESAVITKLKSGPIEP